VKQLVVNADDLGMTRGINRAIVEAYRHGIVTSTSLLANGAAFDDAVERLRECPGLGVGLHVNVTEGRPVAAGAQSSLLDGRGCFRQPHWLAIRMSAGAVSARDLEVEITAQVQRIARAGIAIDHFDSHQNIHLHPVAARALAAVAGRTSVPWIRFKGQRPLLPALLREAGLLPIREQMRHLAALVGYQLTARGERGRAQVTRAIVGAPQLRRASPRQLLGAMVPTLPEGVTEWVCHPGYADTQLRAIIPGADAQRRGAELEVLTDPDSRTLLQAAGIELVSYRQLAIST
jgi:chitin disaccharide deacetylase